MDASDRRAMILGQVNFFMEFDLCFFRSQAAFEVKPKGDTPCGQCIRIESVEDKSSTAREQSAGTDRLQRPLVHRSRFRRRFPAAYELGPKAKRALRRRRRRKQ
jgi:hypothetical protein